MNLISNIKHRNVSGQLTETFLLSSQQESRGGLTLTHFSMSYENNTPRIKPHCQFFTDLFQARKREREREGEGGSKRVDNNMTMTAHDTQHGQ